MGLDFSSYREGIERVSRQSPAMPKDRVVLNRLFFFIFKELDESYNRLLAEYGLNSSSFLALVMLLSRADNRLNPCHLSEALIASRTNVTRMTDELVHAGWVDRTPSREDRRRIDLSLTEAGHALIMLALPAIWNLIERQWAGFSADEVIEFDRLLHKLLAGLERCDEQAR